MFNNSEKFEIRDLREKNWFTMDNRFLDEYAPFLGVYAVGVYNSLCRHADKKQKAYPAEKTIAWEVNISPSMVGKSIKYLLFWGIIKKTRVGKHCTNRYYLLRKSTWKPINEESLREFSDVFHIDFRCLQDKLQSVITNTSNSKNTQSKNTQEKGGSSFKNNLEILEAYKKGNRTFSPFYGEWPMRWASAQHKWGVIKNGEWSEYGDKENKIEWVSKI